MVWEDKLGSDKALEQFKEVVDKYYAGHEARADSGVQVWPTRFYLTYMYIVSLL